MEDRISTDYNPANRNERHPPSQDGESILEATCDSDAKPRGRFEEEDKISRKRANWNRSFDRLPLNHPTSTLTITTRKRTLPREPPIWTLPAINNQVGEGRFKGNKVRVALNAAANLPPFCEQIQPDSKRVLLCQMVVQTER